MKKEYREVGIKLITQLREILLSMRDDLPTLPNWPKEKRQECLSEIKKVGGIDFSWPIPIPTLEDLDEALKKLEDDRWEEMIEDHC